LRGHEDGVSSVAFSPDGKIIASGSYDKTIILWNTESGKRRRKPLNGHTEAVTSLAFSPDGKIIASSSQD
jgi:WD40 repeat protein